MLECQEECQECYYNAIPGKNLKKQQQKKKQQKKKCTTTCTSSIVAICICTYLLFIIWKILNL